MSLPEPFETAFRGIGVTLAYGALSGTSGRGCATAEYGTFCRDNKANVVARINEVVGRDSNGVRAVRVVDDVPRKYDGADLYLEVFIKDMPQESLYYVLTCPIGKSATVTVERVQG